MIEQWCAFASTAKTGTEIFHRLHFLLFRLWSGMGGFSQCGPSNQNGTTNNGIEWFRHATLRNMDLGFSHYRDGVHRMGLTLPQTCFADVSGLASIRCVVFS